MKEEREDAFVDIAKNFAEKGITAFADMIIPSLMHAGLRKRRLENAIAGLEDVQSELNKRGLTIDYTRYFEEHLKIPVLVVEHLADEDSPSSREFLKRLFIKHLTGSYEDDSLYPAFIKIIEELSPIDAGILKSIYEVLINMKWSNLDALNYNLQLSHAKLMLDFNVDEITLKASLGNLERCRLITTLHSTETFHVGRNLGAYIGDPLLTPIGVLFIRACME
jgi:hypothetical protein